VQDVIPAASAILVEFQTVRVVPLILGSSVIALLASGAGQVNYNAILLSCHFKRSLSLKLVQPFLARAGVFFYRPGAKNSQKNSGVLSPRMN
jgi:hypothetical protein